jgi:hypothetical protein
VHEGPAQFRPFVERLLQTSRRSTDLRAGVPDSWADAPAQMGRTASGTRCRGPREFSRVVAPPPRRAVCSATRPPPQASTILRACAAVLAALLQCGSTPVSGPCAAAKDADLSAPRATAASLTCRQTPPPFSASQSASPGTRITQ